MVEKITGNLMLDKTQGVIMAVVAKKCPPRTRKESEKCKSNNRKKKTSATPIIIEETEESNGAGNGEALICCECGLIITFSNEKIEVNGAYNHSFANPHGLFFEIGCFKNAPGCAYSNESSSEFTWFRGFSWRIAVCRGCTNHIGWLFSSSKSSFHGLISDKLATSRTKEE